MKANARCSWRQSACQRSLPSHLANSGSENSCSRITWYRRRSRTRFRSTNSSSAACQEWREPKRSSIRRKLARAVAVMTAQLHNAGLLHHDFHPGNILLRVNHADEPELFMIDLDAMRACRRVTWKLAKQNLALLDHYFWLRSSRTDRYRFLKTYLRTRTEPPPAVGRFARQIEDSTRLWAERLWRRWGRRCRSSNKYFEVFRGALTWCVASRDLDPGELKALIDDPDLPFEQHGSTRLKSSRTTTVAETTMLVRGRPTAVIYKRFNRKKLARPDSELVSSVPRMAIVAGRPGSCQPRNPDPSKPRILVAQTNMEVRPALLVLAP